MSDSQKDKENDEVVLKLIDSVLDSYNDKRIVKDVMLKRCKQLYTKLSLTFTQNRVE
jgi:hypothetical protein